MRIVDIVSVGSHRCLLKSCVTSNTWYAESFRWTCDVLRRLRESWAWLMRYNHIMVGNFLSHMISQAIKWFLKLFISISAALTRWLCGLTHCIWIFSSIKYILIDFDSTLSMIFKHGLDYLLVMCVILVLNALIIISSLLSFIDIDKISFFVQ